MTARDVIRRFYGPTGAAAIIVGSAIRDGDIVIVGAIMLLLGMREQAMWIGRAWRRR